MLVAFLVAPARPAGPENRPNRHVISKAFPFSHAVDFFQSSLYDNDPWSTLAREAAWLVGLAVAFGAAARLRMRRLLA